MEWANSILARRRRSMLYRIQAKSSNEKLSRLSSLDKHKKDKKNRIELVKCMCIIP